MPIKPPAWCKGAVPVLSKGWVDPNTNELLVSSRFNQAQIDEFYGMPSFEDIQDMNQHGKIEAAMAAMEAAPEVVEKDDDIVADFNQDGIIDNLESMSKIELEALGRENGVELDRRKSKAKLIETLRGFLN